MKYKDANTREGVQKRSIIRLLTTMVLVVGLVFTSNACSSGDVDDALNAIDEPDRKTIDTSRMGINAFANNQGFGTICEQYREVRSTLGLRFVRILFAWNDQVQPTPESAPNFSFYDDIAECLPRGVEALVVVTGLPSWMSDPANWIDGNPRTTFVQRWLRRVARRYAGNSRITGFQVWNEPNMLVDPDNTTMGFIGSPENFVEMMALGFNSLRENAPGKLVVNAATTAIAQNFRDTLNYNKDMVEAGIVEFVDVFAIHFYGTSYERVETGDGVADFLNGVPKPVWITESGRQGVNNQLEYVERTWPFLREQIPSIDRIFYYQFTSADPADSTFALRTLDPAFPVSDLYIHLRERAG